MKSLSFLLKFVSFSFISSRIVNAVKDDVTFQDDIPPVKIVHDMVVLSKLVYEVHSIEDKAIPKEWGPILFEETSQGTEVLIVVPKTGDRNYVAVVFRGTEEFEDVLTDIDAFEVDFGPPGGVITEAGSVHEGFNEAAFDEDVHLKIEEAVKSVIEEDPSLDIYYTGHSLGGALSSLLGAYMATKIDKNINVINFGSPGIGSETFKNWARSLSNLAIWRVVNDNDAVARLPCCFTFWHAGHLIELEDKEALLYWQQTGNETLGYASPPWWWKYGAIPTDHLKDKYVSYISVKSMQNPEKFYVTDFERTGKEREVPLWAKGFEDIGENQLRKSPQ